MEGYAFSGDYPHRFLGVTSSSYRYIDPIKISHMVLNTTKHSGERVKYYVMILGGFIMFYMVQYFKV